MKIIASLLAVCALAGNVFAPPPPSDIASIRKDFDAVCDSFRSLAGPEPKTVPPWTLQSSLTGFNKVTSLQRSAHAVQGRAIAESESAMAKSLDDFADSNLRRELNMMQLALKAGPVEYFSLVSLPGANKSSRMKRMMGHLWDTFVLAEAEAKSFRFSVRH